ncbi:hypothetical protein SAICODRAFT_25062 [Saitoella complicata NRRL Y-17804]|uniref:uncharacterized protein n=1 Tax=Saitoella complicata (strain BCRC 22490 / CBS 7301 / JCM 7358 / NBRC 10748 / NRRL Y-17804) TaxID=698492 RepID=UPI000866AE89|nr:uncharacterized protein SAICODRAFT_25062 [Saitoella complicata NRRL Y-17804]ODQ53391.1 hypothetical protein SAICODRAFT_25062 [Saitoella complicata NRRL Y-17804]
MSAATLKAIIPPFLRRLSSRDTRSTITEDAPRTPSTTSSTITSPFDQKSPRRKSPKRRRSKPGPVQLKVLNQEELEQREREGLHIRATRSVDWSASGTSVRSVGIGSPSLVITECRRGSAPMITSAPATKTEFERVEVLLTPAAEVTDIAEGGSYFPTIVPEVMAFPPNWPLRDEEAVVDDEVVVEDAVAEEEEEGEVSVVLAEPISPTATPPPPATAPLTPRRAISFPTIDVTPTRTDTVRSRFSFEMTPIDDDAESAKGVDAILALREIDEGAEESPSRPSTNRTEVGGLSVHPLSSGLGIARFQEEINGADGFDPDQYEAESEDEGSTALPTPAFAPPSFALPVRPLSPNYIISEQLAPSLRSPVIDAGTFDTEAYDAEEEDDLPASECGESAFGDDEPPRQYAGFAAVTGEFDPDSYEDMPCDLYDEEDFDDTASLDSAMLREINGDVGEDFDDRFPTSESSSLASQAGVVNGAGNDDGRVVTEYLPDKAGGWVVEHRRRRKWIDGVGGGDEWEILARKKVEKGCI